MSASYLLLRNNKQTGPFPLQALLQQELRPNDLIWVEGQSAGWRNPSEIDSLKQFFKTVKEKTEIKEVPKPESRNEAPVKVEGGGTKRLQSIYVSLPAGMPLRAGAETPEPDALEAKAEALHRRIQAFAAGQPATDDETHYSRTLADMQHEYGAWQRNQQKQKKWRVGKRYVGLAALFLALLFAGVGLYRWWDDKEEPLKRAEAETLPFERDGSEKEKSLAVLTTATDSLSSISVDEKNSVPNKASQVATQTLRPLVQKDRRAKQAIAESLRTAPPDTVAPTSTQPKQVSDPAPVAFKKNVPLSRLVTVHSAPDYTKKGTGINATGVTLQNNSTETLKTVVVHLVYLKKDDREIGRETVTFYDVAPATAPVITASGNRRATSVHVKIGAITRTDGSLYLIH